MNNYIFKDSNGKQYKRIDKRQAKKLYDAGETVIFCPCNLRPFDNYFGLDMDINRANINCNFADFRKIVSDYELFNCTDTETGKYTAFYACIE